MTPSESVDITLPKPFVNWFKKRGWTLRDYQRDMLERAQTEKATLLIAPTGAGKTLSGFLPSLTSLHTAPRDGLHTLYISPLKALTQDIHRNLLEPVEEMGLDITVETRTGDTPSHKRQRQRKRPPNMLLTTPESLMLMLSYADADRLFGNVERVIVDEVHSLIANKRGDFTALALARLQQFSPQCQRIGLSATVAWPELLASWLGGTDNPAGILQVPATTKPKIHILESKTRMPFGGFMARYAIEDIYQAVSRAQTTLVFVNTRAQSELLFQMLWEQNKAALPIALTCEDA